MFYNNSLYNSKNCIVLAGIQTIIPLHRNSSAISVNPTVLIPLQIKRRWKTLVRHFLTDINILTCIFLNRCVTGRNVPNTRPTDNFASIQNEFHHLMRSNLSRTWVTYGWQSNETGHLSVCDVTSTVIASTLVYNRVSLYKAGESIWQTSRASVTRLRFGDRSYPSLGTMKICIPIPNRSFFKVHIGLVSADVLI